MNGNVAGAGRGSVRNGKQQCGRGSVGMAGELASRLAGVLASRKAGGTGRQAGDYPGAQ